MRGRRFLAGVVGVALCAAAGSLMAQTADPNAIRTNVVVDSNPAVFAVLAALNAAGYNNGLEAPHANPALLALRKKLRAEMVAQPVPALTELRQYFQTHQRGTAAQNIAQYVTLALFLGPPPSLTLTVPASGLPPEAESVSDVVPILSRFYTQANLDALWNEAQPQYALALAQDTELLRATFARVNTFFRMPPADTPAQFFVFPDLMIAPGESDALSYNGNYYVVVNLDLAPQIADVRHSYLHFKLDPLLSRYPAFSQTVQDQILPLVQKAPALEVQFKNDAQLFTTECIVRATEIQLDPGTPEQKQAKVQADMAEGLVMTQFWYDALTTFRDDPANFSEFYPYTAFAARLDEIAGTARHIQFTAAPAADAAPAAEPLQAPSLLDQANARFDLKDFATAATLATAYLKLSGADRASAYYLLGKVAAMQNHAQAAAEQFLLALAAAGPAQAHVKTWSNIYLARLFDAQNDRTSAIKYYRAALATADTPVSKSIASDGIKAPYNPAGPGRGRP